MKERKKESRKKESKQKERKKEKKRKKERKTERKKEVFCNSLSSCRFLSANDARANFRRQSRLKILRCQTQSKYKKYFEVSYHYHKPCFFITSNHALHCYFSSDWAQVPSSRLIACQQQGIASDIMTTRCVKFYNHIINFTHGRHPPYIP